MGTIRRGGEPFQWWKKVQNPVTAWMLQTRLTVMVANISLLLQASAIIQPMSIDTVRRQRYIPLFSKNRSKWELGERGD